MENKLPNSWNNKYIFKHGIMPADIKYDQMTEVQLENINTWKHFIQIFLVLLQNAEA